MRGLMTTFLAVALAVGLCPAAALANQEGAGSAPRFVAAPLATQSSATDESEPNDDFDHATNIDMNRWVYAIGDGEFSDGDYYQVKLPQSGSITLTFVNGRHNSDGEWFQISLYDKYYEEVEYLDDAASSFIGTYSTKPVLKKYNLKKGINRIHILGYDNHPYHFKLTYNIPSISISKVVAAKKAFTAKWVKKSGAAKYQLRYSTSKNMGKAKTLNVSKSSSSKKVGKLKSNKKYWAQVRVAKKIGGQTYWSNWSAKKAVKTK